jgi:23S rRNA (uracil1939-C5)-methyltransferase
MPEETEEKKPGEPAPAEPPPGRPRRGMVLEGTVTDAGDREAVAATPFGPVRVRGAVPGDRVRLRIVRAGQHASFARIEAILAPSPQRVVPRCGATALCGGCPWQSWDPAAQREEKRRRVEQELKGLGGVEIAPVAAARDFGFRNKLLLAAGGHPGKIRFGLYAPRTHRLVPAEDCPVQDPEGNRIVKAIASVLDRQRIQPYDERNARGILRHLLVRVAPGTGQAGVVFVVRTWPIARWQDLGTRILEIPGIASLHRSVNEAAGPVALGPETLLWNGRPRILASAGRVRFLLSPATFFQTNTPALPLLLAAVGEALPGRMRHFADLYSGAGLFALSFARRAAQVSAVDEDEGAVRDLQESARVQNLRQVLASAGDAARAPIPGPAPDAVILDPPRAGIPAGLARRITEEWRPSRVVHVSCSTQALARDLAMLSSRGYRILKVQPIDLFPHTPHVEVVAALARQ